MPIDEFGREIPAALASTSASSNNRTRSRSRSRELDFSRNHDVAGGSSGAGAGGERERGGGGPNNPRSPTRGGGDEYYSRGRSRGNSRGISPSPEGGRDREYGDHRRYRGRSRGGSEYDYDDRHYERRRGRSYSDHRGSSRHGGRRGRSRSYDEGGDYHRHGSSSHGRSKALKPHPSEKYVEQPMLCQFLWKKGLEDEVKLARGEVPTTDHAGNSDQEKKTDENTASSGDNVKPEDEEMKQTTDSPQVDPLFENPEAETEAYADYNMKYCLNYVRIFFNHHLDDPWFRQRLSPLEAVRKAQKERIRSNNEAAEFRKEILTSLEEQQSGVIPKKDPDCPDYLAPPKCNFVSGCRLGVGTKPTTSLIPSPFYRRRNYDDDNAHEEESHHIVLQGEDRNRIERHAKSHLHSFIKSDSCVKIMDVPPHASDDQILASLAEHCTIKPPTAIWSSAVSIPSNGSSSMDPYHRIVFAVFPSREAKDNMIENLFRSNEEGSKHHHRRSRDGKNMPRHLDLDVDCTDVYGRREVDSDGKGAAPEMTEEEKASKKPPDHRLPLRRCTVFVSTVSLSPSQPVSVLSAAVSSRERVRRDKEDVRKIARTLDEVREIKAGNRLDGLLHLLYPGNELAKVDDEDILDVSIAYLRRVHLFSFYNGCTAASDVGDVLTGQHPAGTIHLRLKNADEILRKATEEKSGNAIATEVGAGEQGGEKEGCHIDPSKHDALDDGNDMLVMRLNESISNALDHVKMLAEQGCLIDEQTDAAAKNIETQEQQTKIEWAENHGIIDGDGRARCSFHFCKKLFKDRAFLQKHLMKKHSDQLRGECGKCHDDEMMASWDSDENRPVPSVLIDCGSKFGMVPSAVIGSDRPIAVDPEPDLWKEEEERMREEERKYQERQAAAEAVARAEEEEQNRIQQEMSANAGEKRKANFVDVDDMVEEKVELSFENVDIAPPPKKKKKKKKSLL